jgi:hypothetical protein
MVSSGFLLVAAISSIIWDALTISPNLLGFASSVLKESSDLHFSDKLPMRPSASVTERIRTLGDVMVMMQDAKPLDPVGKIELGTVHPGAKKLEVGRSYY